MSLLDRAVEDIKAALPPLPDGFFVRREGDQGVLVGNAELAFALTPKDIADNNHVYRATKSYPALLMALAQHHALMAASYDRKGLFLIADSLREDYIDTDKVIADFERRMGKTNGKSNRKID